MSSCHVNVNLSNDWSLVCFGPRLIQGDPSKRSRCGENHLSQREEEGGGGRGGAIYTGIHYLQYISSLKTHYLRYLTYNELVTMNFL